MYIQLMCWMAYKIGAEHQNCYKCHQIMLRPKLKPSKPLYLKVGLATLLLAKSMFRWTHNSKIPLCPVLPGVAFSKYHTTKNISYLGKGWFVSIAL